MIYKKGRHEIEIYDSIYNMPMLRFQRFNKYQMQACDIGSDINDYNNRTAKAIQFIQKGMKDEAVSELQNRMLTVNNAFTEFNPNNKSLALLVKRIDKKEYKYFDTNALDECVKHLDKIGLNSLEAIEKLKTVKKKSKRNWVYIMGTYFLRILTGIKRT